MYECLCVFESLCVSVEHGEQEALNRGESFQEGHLPVTNFGPPELTQSKIWCDLHLSRIPKD